MIQTLSLACAEISLKSIKRNRLAVLFSAGIKLSGFRTTRQNNCSERESIMRDSKALRRAISASEERSVTLAKNRVRAD